MLYLKKRIETVVILAVFTLTMCFSLFAFPQLVFADTYMGSDIEYTYTTGSGTAEVTGFNGSPTDVNILESFTVGDNDYTVISIGDSALYDCTSLTSVTIPDSVTSIGDSAFRECTSLTSVTIPDSVTSIGTDVFYGCSSLPSITIPDSVTSISAGVFAYCTSLPSITIPDSVTSIGEAAFFGCTSLPSITIPDSVTSIGEVVFFDCTSLKTAFILGSPTLGSNCFNNSAPGGLIDKPSELSGYKFYTDLARTNEWDFNSDARTAGDATTLLYGVIKQSGGSIQDNTSTECEPEPKHKPKPWEITDIKYYEKSYTGFTTMFYSRFFNRPPEQEGLDAWLSRLQSEDITGADLVYGFVFGKECQTKIADYTDEEFIIFLYKVILDRTPEDNGFDAWIARLASGMTKEEVVKMFTMSPEFANLCIMFGVLPYIGYESLVQ